MSLDQTTDFVKHQTISHDAFLGGRLTLAQPLRGFRAGTDSVLLGAAVRPESEAVLDLGAGVGTAGLVALSLGLVQRAHLAERDAATARLAHENVLSNGFAEKAQVLEVDVADPAGRRAVGIPENHFDAVIANPPYFAAGRGTRAPDAGRAHARHMEAETIDKWVRCAAAAARAGGTAIFIYPAAGLTALLSGFEGRFGGLVVLPLSPRPDAPVSRVLVRGVKGSRAPLTLLSSRALHGAEGNGFAQEFDAILRGDARLDW